MGMNDIKSVLLAGASGVFGRHIAGELTAAGYRVLSLGRGAGNDVVADLMDHDSLLRASTAWRSTRSCTRPPRCARRR